jgi:Tol biopolymer transport system component/DNA-binding winged helix-turn-helix (wHTH) protein
MENSYVDPCLKKFGVFEADLRSGELRKAGLRIKLQEQPFKLLVLLLEHPGQVVTREELRNRIWPEESFGDFDHAVNVAVGKLRMALNDSSAVPRFVETLPKRGYRFIASVSGAAISPESPSLQASRDLKAAHELSGRRVWLAGGASLSVLLLLFGLWLFLRKPFAEPLPPMEIVPLVGFEGEASHPAFSPDGHQIAFAMHAQSDSGIYISSVNGGKPFQLTSGPHVGYPRWSPDGQEIAFLRESRDDLAIYVLPVFGGIERRLYSGPATQFSLAFDWSPDGKALAISQSDPDKIHARIAVVRLDGSGIRPLTTPSRQDIDISPAFSPDGSTVAFVRSNAGGMVSEVYVVSIGSGEAKRLTDDRRVILGNLAWTPDSKEIVFSSTRGGAPNLWRISASGGAPKAVSGSSVNAINPVISRKGNLLAYEQTLFQSNIWRVTLANGKSRQGAPVPIVMSKGLNGRPRFSSDGKKIVFESSRSGYSEIWICESEGSNCSSLTSLRGVAGAAQWSPDDRYVAFEFHPNAYSEVYIAEVAGAPPRMVTTFPGADNGGPNWSRDGKSIYFYTDRDGRFQLWKVRPDGGSPIQVTRNGGIFGIESSDGKFLYFAKFQDPGIWRMPLNGGEETRILDAPEYWFNWSLTNDGIYFLDGTSIQFFDFARRQKHSILTLDRDASDGLAISPDHKSLLFAQAKLSEANIVLVENFR